MISEHTVYIWYTYSVHIVYTYFLYIKSEVFFFLIQVFVVGVLKKKRKKFKKENFWKPCHDAKSTVWIWACTLKSDNKPKK